MKQYSEAEAPRVEQFSIWIWILGAAAAATLVGAGTFVAFGALTGHGWWPWNNTQDNRPDLYEVTRSAVAAAALVAAAVAGAITIRRQRSTEYSVRIAANAQRIAALTYHREIQNDDAAVVSRLRDRYTTTAEQLGHDSPAIRLAGAYALAALADEWLDRNEDSAGTEARTCIDLLCAYVRTPRASVGDDHGAEVAADKEVRQTIVRVITAHLQPDSRFSWSAMNLDFTGAVFDGNYTFDGAEFSGGTVSFDGAAFAGGAVNFRNATFSNGHVSFRRARFYGGHVSFRRAKFSGGGTVSFSSAEFSGSHVSFNGAQFSGITVSFIESEISAGTVSFNETGFLGGAVCFDRAKFASGHTKDFSNRVVHGPWSSIQPPRVWPIPEGDTTAVAR